MIKIISEYEELEESRFNKNNLYFHTFVRKHIFQYKKDPRFPNFSDMTVKQLMNKYNEIAEELSNMKASSPFSENRIVGYIDKNGRTVKYDRFYEDYLVFNKDDSITMFKKTENQFRSVVRRDFKKELPEE